MNTRTLPAVLLLGCLLTSCGGSSTPPLPAISLHEAIVMRDADAVQAHADAGTDVNAADANGITPLIAASTSGQLDVMRLLLNAGADINGRGPNGNTALIHAINAYQTDAALFLMDQSGIELDARGSSGTTALVEAIPSMQLDVAKALVEHGAAINGPGPYDRTPLHVAAPLLHADAIAWLLEHGADANAVDADGMTPLHAACMFPETVDAFAGVDVEGALTMLIEASTDVDARDNRGQTPLHIAVAWAHPWITRALLDAGADPLAMNAAGDSPITFLSLGEMGRPRTLEESMAIIALFREAGLTDETPINDKGSTLPSLIEWLHDRR